MAQIHFSAGKRKFKHSSLHGPGKRLLDLRDTDKGRLVERTGGNAFGGVVELLQAGQQAICPMCLHRNQHAGAYRGFA
jgi:hypothetical protein